MRGSRLFATVFVAACHTAARQSVPAAPTPAVRPDSSHSMASMMTVDSAPTRYTAVQFMQGMIAHHAQALEMTALIPTRTSREDFRLLGQRIDISQKDEITAMQRWLRDHGADVPSLDAPQIMHHAAGQMMLMPGMLTHEELAQLEKSTGVA